MIAAIYIEEAIADHPRTREICARFPKVPQIPCNRYGEVFNRKAQNFRLQKRRPSLILAHKQEGYVLPTPAGYGIGGQSNFYFSHMLNCLYDCRYCFLQGMYRSANYVVFVNYEDFFEAIVEKTQTGPKPVYFFSGYDCDSLAFEGATHFVQQALPIFRRHPSAWLELRTKSVHIDPLLKTEPFENCVVAFSFTPQEVSDALEHQVPSVARRVGAMEKLAAQGWNLGLRFDPLIHVEDYQQVYRRLFDQILTAIPTERLHSVSLGPFRLPTGFFRRVEKLYPDEPLFSAAFEKHGASSNGSGAPAESGTMVSYPRALERQMVEFCETELARRVPAEILFPCPLPES